MNGAPGSPPPLLEVTGLEKRFPAAGGRVVHAVNGVSFGVAAGETFGLVGESGSGKSTVGNCILRLVDPTTGSIRFGGQEIATLPERAFRPLRRQIGMVFQDPSESLNPRLRAGQAIEDPLCLQTTLSARERRARVAELLRTVLLDPDVHADRYPHQLSGGQQQRVGVARAIATDPRFVVLDEPTSSLDASVRGEIVALLKRLQDALGLTYLFISHDLHTIRSICRRVAVMYLGRIVEIGPAEDVFERPRHPYTLALLSALPSPRVGVRRDRFRLGGEAPSPIDLPPGCHLASRCPLTPLPICREQYPPLVEVGPGHFAACHQPEAVSSRRGSTPRGGPDGPTTDRQDRDRDRRQPGDR